jgi:transposase
MEKTETARRTLRYSESFKLEVIRKMELEGLSASSVSRRYEIKGSRTVKNWLKVYGKHHLITKRVIVMSTKEEDIINRLRKENEDLRKLVVKLQLDSLTQEAIADIACEQLKVDKEAIKKKLVRS